MRYRKDTATRAKGLKPCDYSQIVKSSFEMAKLLNYESDVHREWQWLIDEGIDHRYEVTTEPGLPGICVETGDPVERDTHTYWLIIPDEGQAMLYMLKWR